MRRLRPLDARLPRHRSIFSPHSGSMIIHAQRESGLAHQTMTLGPWQVQALRLLTSRWVGVALAAGLLTWGYFAVQATRVPLLVLRLERMEQDSAHLDSLRRTVALLQGRYEQVQQMLAAPTPRAGESEQAPVKKSPPRSERKVVSTKEAEKQPD